MKKIIAIVAGGNSGEREISLKSAAVVKKNLDAKKYDAYVIDIWQKDWVLIDDKGKKHFVDKNDFSITIQKKKISFDCVFIAIHGTPGEDGKLQGYFDLLGIPYTSCGPTTSALTFNKSFCVKTVSTFGVQTAKSVHLFKGNKFDAKKIISELSLPCFVKPNNGGSSVGMSKVTKASELKKAIEKAFKEDDEVLIEEFVDGTEITCGMMRYKRNLIVFPITEVVSKKDFFDYEAKYVPGMSQEITPARISLTLENKCKATASLIYNKLNCRGVVRMDFIANKNGLFFLEANTVPGLTEQSLVPQQARAMGISTKELFTMMVEDAIS